MDGGDIERIAIGLPDDGLAWRALYEGPSPEAEPVEDDEADVALSEIA